MKSKEQSLKEPTQRSYNDYAQDSPQMRNASLHDVINDQEDKVSMSQFPVELADRPNSHHPNR